MSTKIVQAECKSKRSLRFCRGGVSTAQSKYDFSLSVRGRRRMRRPPVAGRCSPPHGAAAGCRSSGFDRRANLSNCILADLRSAGSHCENSGSSDGSGASARSDRVKSEVFRDRSASAGGDTRYFSRCLIFWCFWIKPKARKKENVQQKKLILRKKFRRQDRLRRICGSEPAEARRWGRAPQCCGGR